MTVLDQLGSLAGQVVDAAGSLGLGVVVLAATAGSTLGAWFVHAVGRRGGRDRVQRWARRLGLAAARWTRLEAQAVRHGDWVVLLGRLVPGVRSAVSLPAGALGMPVARFLVLTALGSAVWNAAWIGGAAWLVDHGAEVLAALADARPAVLAGTLLGAALVLVQQTGARTVVR